MRRLIIIGLMICSGSVMGQYAFKKADAPTNQYPIRYTLEHFGLHGPVVEYDDGIGKYFFNNQGQLVKEENMLGSVTDYIYNSSGKLSKVVSEIWGTALTYLVSYDGNGRPLYKKDSFTSVGEAFIYDSRGNYIEKRDSQSNKLLASFKYDNRDRLIETKTYYDGKHSLKTYNYQKQGNSLLVKSFYQPIGDKAPTNSTYYYNSNGDYCGIVPCNGSISKDKFGNALYFLNADAKASTPKMYKYRDGTTSDNYKKNNYVDIANKTMDSFSKDASSSSTTAVDVGTPAVPTTTNPAKTTGCVSGDCNNGWGKYKYNNGYYEGYWSGGKKSGYGLYSWNDGGTYVGSWASNDMNGYGIYTAANKNIQKGIFKSGELNGLAVTKTGDKWKQGWFTDGKETTGYTFYSTGSSSGCTIGDCQNKYGKMVWDNGDHFVGFFKNGQLHMGTYTFSSGASYSGQFNNKSQFHGMGRWWSAAGDYYGGSWKNGKMDGPGYHSKKNPQKVEIGDFVSGNLVRSRG